MNKRFWSASLWLLFVFVSCQKSGNNGGSVQPVTGNTFTNPILSSGPDPWITKQGNLYYYTHTLGDRIALWKTPKVTELKNVTPQTIWTAPASGQGSRNVWAPELHFLNNKWYAYYAADDGNNANHRIYVLENTAADPLAGTWVSKGKVSDPSDKWAIDGTVFDYQGQLYLLWSGWQGDVNVRQDIYIAKMRDPLTIDGNRVMISTPTYDWEKIGDPDVNEGPQIIRNAAGRVFLIFSASGCWTDDYSLGLLTLKNGGDPMNPADWTKTPTPVFTKAPSAYGPGHNSFFKSADGTEDWIIYHANAQSGQPCSDQRNPRIQKFSWNADGTPHFGTPVNTTTNITKPMGE
jgi:GH43 family beta-xylosidase